MSYDLVEAMCRKFITAGGTVIENCYEAELFLRGIKQPLMSRMEAALAEIERCGYVPDEEARPYVPRPAFGEESDDD